MAATACCESCLAGERKPEELIEALEHSGLRGLGGAGFPTGRKWRLVRQEPAPRLLAVNADEGEPGTFKDRYFLETDPHRFLEGMLIAAWVVEAADIYIYLRDEYPQCRAILDSEIAAIERGRAVAARPYPPAPRRRRLYLRRRVGDARKHRGQARAAAAQAAVSGARSGSSAGRPCATMSRPSTGCATSSKRVPDWFTGQGRNGRKGLRTLLGVGTGARTPGSSSPRPGSPRAS